MSTGIETWNMNLLDIGPMYPFPGIEVLLAIIGLATWIVWHIIQMKAEGRTMMEEEQRLSHKARLEAALRLSSAETLKEELAAHHDNYKG